MTEETNKMFEFETIQAAPAHSLAECIDIEQSVDSIKDELPEHLHEQAIHHFLNGYCSVVNVDETILSLLPAFRRYINLFRYTRCLRALYEK